MSLVNTNSGKAHDGGPVFSEGNSVQMGVHLQNGNPCVTYIRQFERRLKLFSGSSSAGAYDYATLPPRSIRLLKIIPQADPDLLCFDFKIYSLDEITSNLCAYTAISYCWGDLPADRRLAIGDDSWLPISTKVEKILTTVTARHAMAHLGKDGYHMLTPMLWLDAVCINQKDNDEKASQVRHMADIYTYANSVDIWFDNPQIHANPVYGLPSLGERKDKQPKLEVGMSREHDSWLIEPYSTPEITDLMWCPWFTRAWVVQEFCFGKNHCFHYGSMTITTLFLKMVRDWGNDLAFCRVVNDDRTHCHVPIPPLIQTLESLWTLRDEVMAGADHRRSLEDLLGRFFGLKTTDPRDKIFALLGLASGDCLKHITIDYDIPVADLYLKVMRAIYADFTSFVLLSFAGVAADRPAFTGRPDIPTWVPDFSQPLCHTTWSSRMSGFNACALPDNSIINSHVYRIETPSAACPRSYGVLLNGVSFDSVAGILRGDESRDLSKLAKFVGKAAAAIDSLRPYPNGATAQSVLRSTLVAANSAYFKQDTEGEGFDSFYSHVRDRNRTFNLDHVWKLKGRYLQTMMKEGVGSSRGIFWTRKGYIGLAANECRVGDEVWLVQGARVPYIFRCPASTKMVGEQSLPLYHLVCEAYVHGIMHGEQWNDGQNAVRVVLI